jgi:ABC-2 type transport system ATP-binding protein
VSSPLVEISGLTKVYRGMERPALDDLSLAIRPGSFFGLLGPNGAGKSTLISILCGLLGPTRGQVQVGGNDVRAAADAVKGRIGLVPQDLALYPVLTARENLRFFGRMQGLSGARLRARVDACLAIARLEGLADRRAETYSGGLKRRLNLVIGLIHEPQLLILDEPTVGIDPQSRHFIHQSLRELHAGGMTLIYSTHYMEEAEQLCDYIAIIDHGRILARGSLPELLRQYHDGAIETRLDADLPARLAPDLRGLPHVHGAEFGPRRFVLKSADPVATLPAMLALLERERLPLAALSVGAPNLEQLFLSLTGTRLRD